MSEPSSLCAWPPAPLPGCCDPPGAVPPAPVLPTNPPGLASIGYRIGTFTTFRRAMLDRVAQPGLLGGPANPFVQWREGAAGDYQTTFVELWAYLADILTFYQERIANEAYLATATQRASLLRLAQLIDYRPAPGSAASALLAFTVEKGKLLTIAPGFRVGSKPAPGKPPAVFETSAALAARGEHSAIPLSTVAPTNQWASLGAFAFLAGSGTRAIGSVLAQEVYGSAATTYLRTFVTETGSASLEMGPAVPIAPNLTAAPAAPVVATAVTQAALGRVLERPGDLIRVYGGLKGSATRAIVLQGTGNRLAAGDFVLVVEFEGTAHEKLTPHHLSSVSTDRAGNTTTITWDDEPAGTSYDAAANLYALRVSAGAFGNDAPAWNTLPPSLIGTDGGNGPYAGKNWDDPNDAGGWFYLPAPGDPGNTIFLDGLYEGAAGSPISGSGWAVLASGTKLKAFALSDVRAASKAAYATSSRVTRLTFGANVDAKTFPLRDTLVLAGVEPLTLQNDLPLPDPLSGSTLVLAGLYPHLQDAQAVFVQGTLFAPGASEPARGTEAAFLAGPPVVDTANGITTVTLKHPLSRSYARVGAVLLANVTPATQGETVKDEVLGSGDGSANQQYELKQAPLTYLPAVDGEGLSAVQSTLLVTVNGVRWTEQPTLLESGPADQSYVTSQNDADHTTVIFGDGYNGARPPTGKDNIHARYRKGLGSAGNVLAGGLQQLIDSAAGLQKVTNPQLAAGGADPESIDQIRANAPGSLRTFGRAVSAADYAALALSYPGIAKSSAAWTLRDALGNAVPQPYVALTVATAGQVPLAQQPLLARQLRSFLDSRRDPNVPLRILDFVPVYVDLAAAIEVDPRYPQHATFARALAALNPGLNADGSPGFFAFERLHFGESIHLSAVYAALQAVPGVRAATVTTLRRLDLDAGNPGIVRDQIFIEPSEMAVLANDPADTANTRGKLTITVTGGYLDI